MRVEFLRALEGGITRLRNKGGASASWLYDLVNGYVRQDGSIASRPGTDDEIILEPGTKGLTAANGELVVFASAPTATPAGVRCEVLRHPTDPTQPLLEIHFAGPFLGDSRGAMLYVAAEFANGDVFHYWQRTAGASWGANTVFAQGAMVSPTAPNGLMYMATRLGGTGQKWAPKVDRVLGDKVEPTTANGFTYEAVDMSGNPTTGGSTEPAWIAADGAEVIEYTMDGLIDAPDTGGDGGGGNTTPPAEVSDRYRQLGYGVQL